MEKYYIINRYSKLRFTIVLLTSLITIIPATHFFYKFESIGMPILMFCILLIGFVTINYLPQITSKAIYKIKIDLYDFKIDCVRPYLGSKFTESISFIINDIKSYKFEPSNNFDTFKIFFKSSKSITIYRWYNDTDDDFSKFLTHFKRLVKRHNEKKSTLVPIELEKNIMENKGFLVGVAVTLIIIGVMSIFLILYKGINNPKGFIIIFIVLSPLIWIISQVIKGLKKK